VTTPTRPAGLDPRARAARRLGVLGGSFDPPHRGHRFAAEVARERARLDHVLFVPARQPPHKPELELAEAEHRLAMLELLLAGLAWASTWTGELERSGPSYTIDSLRALRAAAGQGCELFLILGSDNLAGFPRWRAADEIVALARPLVVARRGSPLVAVATAGLSPASARALAEGLCDVEPCDASATDVRARLERGQPIAELVPAAILAYIHRHGLYESA
jgi:nicotinate-nucleotide adenylyltransferase